MTLVELDTLGKPILLQFYADWCAPCRTLSSFMVGLIPEINAKHVAVEQVNIDVNRELTEEFFVRSVPTLILLDAKGNIMWRQAGVPTPQRILDEIEHHGPFEA